MKKKMKSCEKKNGAGNLAVLLPIFCFELRYSRLYSDTGRTGVRMARQDTTTTRPSMPAIRPVDGHDTTYYTAGLRAGCAVARARMAWPGVSRDTKTVSWLGTTFGSRYNARHGLRHDSVRVVTWAQCVRQGPRRHVAILYRDKGAVTRCCDTARQLALAHSDTVGHRRDTAGEGATIRPSPRHDTALCARPGRSVCIA